MSRLERWATTLLLFGALPRRPLVRWWVVAGAITLGWITTCVGPLNGQGRDSAYWTDTLPATATVSRGVAVVFANHLLAVLDSVASSLEVERIYCGLGVIRDTTVYVDFFYPLPLVHSDANGATPAAPCPVATVLDWHNHPPSDRGLPLVNWCYLSKTDIRGVLAAGRPFISMVHVARGVYCWWTYDQIEAADHQRRPLLWPAKGQRSW